MSLLPTFINAINQTDTNTNAMLMERLSRNEENWKIFNKEGGIKRIERKVKKSD